MRRKCFIMAALVIILTVMPINAVIVNNGTFDIDATDWNATGGGGSGGAWDAGHTIEAGNGYVTLVAYAPDPSGWAWAIWYQVGVEEFNVLGIPAGTTVSISADIKEISGNGNLEDAALKIESWSDSANLGAYQEFVTVTTDWENYSIDYTPAPSATALKCVLVNAPETGDPAAEYAYDNVAITIPGGTPALKPVPIVGGGLALSNDVLSWTNPDTAISADVFILESDVILTADPNLGPTIIDPAVEQVADDINAESVDLSDAGFTLQVDKYYYWAVHVTDSNDGGSPYVVIKGFNWYFQTFDAPPTDVSAGVDQYLWLTMDDGTPTDGEVTFTLTGTYTDAGESPVTTTWSLDEDLTETDPATVVTIDNPDDPITTVTIDNTGWFYFDFTVSDDAGSGSDTVNVGVYADACTAANEDPDDIPAKYPNGHGDIDGDCDTDLDDFILLAESWLECMSDKLDCSP